MDVMPLTDVERVKILRGALVRAVGVISDLHAGDDEGAPEMKELLDDLADILIKTRDARK